MNIFVKLKESVDKSYEVVISSRAIDLLTRDLKHKPLGRKYAIIADSKVNQLFGKEMLRKIVNKGLKAEIIVFDSGEKNKNLETVAMLQEQMLKKGFGRDSAIVAFGGGVVGDVAGFVAATFCRGIPYVNVPTTLLAMADSSIGGKTGVNLKQGKNLIGAFHQPKKVYMGINFLNKLSEKELSNGISEIIKTATVTDELFFSYLEKNISKVLNRDQDILTKIIRRSASIKAELVNMDEKETGIRKILNFGHTIGHALEKTSGYKLSHGKAIAIGMLVESEIAKANQNDIYRIEKLLKAAKLPVRIPGKITTESIITAAKIDKKVTEGKTKYVLLKRIGKVRHNKEYVFAVPDNYVKKALNKLKQAE